MNQQLWWRWRLRPRRLATRSPVREDKDNEEEMNEKVPEHCPAEEPELSPAKGPAHSAALGAKGAEAARPRS